MVMETAATNRKDKEYYNLLTKLLGLSAQIDMHPDEVLADGGKKADPRYVTRAMAVIQKLEGDPDFRGRYNLQKSARDAVYHQ